jgi:hypothetical protein
LGGEAGHRARFLQHDLVRVQQTRELDRRLFALSLLKTPYASLN